MMRNQDLSAILSIIIPIHNETIKKVLDIINYYSVYNVSIFVVDSSINSMMHKIEFNNVVYSHLPRTSFPEKIYIISKKIKTKLVLLNPVDDLVSLSLLKDICVWVEKNNVDYFGGYNKSVSSSFKVRKNGVFLNTDKIINMHSYDIFCKYDFPVLWGIYSANSLHNAFKIISNLEFNNENFYELSLTFILPSIGKFAKYHDTVFFRELRTGSWGTKHNSISLAPNRIYFRDQVKLFSIIKISSKKMRGVFGYLFYLSNNTIGLLIGFAKKFLILLSTPNNIR